MRALVTGSEGFIGRHLVAKLRERGDTVCALDRRKGTDLRTARLGAYVRGADVIYHLAGKPGVRSSWEGFDDYLADNLLITQRLLAAAEREGIDRFVYASSSSVYGDEGEPVSPYGVTKLATEALATAYASVPTVGLRYFTVYGPGQRPDMAFSRFIDAAIHGRPVIVYGDGTQSRRFTYVADVVRATLDAATAEPGIYDVAGRETTTILEALEAIGDLLGRKIEVDFRDAAKGDPYSSALPLQLPGFEAQVPIREGLAAQVAASIRS